jgi:hypothetical protein
MINKPRKEHKHLPKGLKSFILGGSLLAALTAADPAFVDAQTTTNTNKNTITVVDSTDALTYAKNNVSKYYPDMKAHLDTMMKSFRDKEHKDSTVALLNKMVENITDPAQKVGAVIEALEFSVFYKSTFGDKYNDKITEETFNYIITFDEEYKTRFKRYYEKIEANITKMKKEIEVAKKDIEKNKKIIDENKKKIESIMNNFSPEDIKNNTSIKNLTLKTEQWYKDNKFSISPHLQTLFDAAK